MSVPLVVHGGWLVGFKMMEVIERDLLQDSHGSFQIYCSTLIVGLNS